MKIINSIFKTFLLALMVIANTHFAYAQTASLLPNAVQQFFDNNGKPLSSGTVTTYIPSTTTFKTTWQDANQATPWANPLTLNAAGRPPGNLGIFGNGTYRQVVKDRLGNIIWDQPTASSGSGSGGGTIATGDGDAVGTIKPWAGMTAPNQYAFTYGQEVNRTTYSVLFTAITSTQAVFCNSGSPILNGLGDTTNFWIGMSLEISCVGAGFTTIISKTSSTVTMATNANVTTNTNAVFFPWGRGNGSTTFNLPDLRGVTLAGNNIMGGIAGSNIDVTYFGATDPNSSGALGGSQSTVLLTANLPAQTPSGNIVVDGSGNQYTPKVAGTNQSITAYQGSLSSAISPGSGIGVYSNTQMGAVTPSNFTFSGTAFAGQNATPFSRVQPTITTNYIIKITPDSNSATASGVTSLGSMTGDIACGTGTLCTGNIISVPSLSSGFTGTGAIVLQTTPSITDPAVANGTFTSPTLVTPTLGVATATSINKVAITAPATSATLTIPNGVTLTGPASSGTAMTLGNNETVTGIKTFGAAGNIGKLVVAGNTSGSTTLNASSTASGTLTLPAATDTLMGKATTDTMTNKTFDSAGTGNVMQISGVTVSRGQYPGENSTGNATSGNIGEFISSTVALGSAVSLTSTTPANITSISLTAGDWDVTGSINFTGATSTTVTTQIGSFSTASATLDTSDGRIISTFYNGNTVYNTINTRASMPTARFSLSSTTTVFFVAQSTFAAGTSGAFGIIRARRIR